MTTRPTDTPDWASAPSGGSVVTEPPTSKQLQGWLDFERPPSAYLNWAWNRFAAWVQHFAASSSVFPTMEDAINAPNTAPLVVGDSCWVDEADGGFPGEEVIADLFNGATMGFKISACGAFVAAAVEDGGGNLEINLANRDGSGVFLKFAPTSVGTLASVRRILTDGVSVLVAYTVTAGAVQTVESFDAATGASNWVSTPLTGGVINDIGWNQIHVYVVGSNNGRELVAVDRTTGATVYAYDHSGVAVAGLRSVAANGQLVFVAGAASGHASLATLRGILALTGADAAGEGGLGIDANAWDQAPTIGIFNGTLVTDGRTLYVTEGGGVRATGTANGVAVGDVFPAPTGNSLSVDQDYVFVDDIGYDKGTRAAVWTGFAPVVTDGTAVFSGRRRIARGNYGPQRFKLIDPATASRVVMRQVLVPTDTK